jgi:hypothetical protein
MDGLENIANRADQMDRQSAQAQEFEPVDDQPKGEAVLMGVSPEQAAENMAESLLSMGFGVVKMILDSRLVMGGDELESGKESLSPVIQKYNLAGGGTGRLPWHEEMCAGLYLGGLYKRVRAALSELKAKDKAKREANLQAENNRNQANYGDQRKYQSQEQSHSLSSSVGVRQEPNANTEGWLGGGG